MPLVAVIAVSVGLVCMYKVHQFSEPEPVITVNGPQAPENFYPKRLTYEVYGPVGKAGNIFGIGTFRRGFLGVEDHRQADGELRVLVGDWRSAGTVAGPALTGLSGTGVTGLLGRRPC